MHKQMQRGRQVFSAGSWATAITGVHAWIGLISHHCINSSRISIQLVEAFSTSEAYLVIM